ncbi:MAG: hypothetical protein OXG55_14040 [bacterium]|nr:hypothetical protein [bacterium]
MLASALSASLLVAPSGVRDAEAQTVVHGLTLSVSALDVFANEGAATYTVQLKSAPSGSVSVAVSSGDTTHVTVDTDPDTSGSQGTLTFAPTGSNAWNVAQTVTVTSASGAAVSDTAVITHSIQDSGDTANYPNGVVSGATVTATVVTDTRPVITVHGRHRDGYLKDRVAEGEQIDGYQEIAPFRFDTTGRVAVRFRLSQEGDLGDSRDIRVYENRLAIPSFGHNNGVRVIDDSVDEPNGKAIATILPRPTHYRIGSPGRAEVLILDDDPTAVTLARASGSAVSEGAAHTYTVTLGRGLVAGESLAVPLTFNSGTGAAVRNTDFTLACPAPLPTGVTCNDLNTASAPTVTFTGPSSGETAASVTLTLTASADLVGGESETVDVGMGTIATTSGVLDSGNNDVGLGGGVTATDDAAALSITDVTQSVSLSAASFKAAEGSPAEVGVVLSAPLVSAVTVTVTANAGTADSPADFAGGTHSVTIPAGQTRGTVSISTVADSVSDDRETFEVVLSGVPAGLATAAPASATVTIAETSLASFAQPATAAAEGSAATVSVELSTAATQAFGLEFALSGSAEPFKDYSVPSARGAVARGRVAVPVGATSVDISVWVVDDAEPEGAETAVLTLIDPGVADVELDPAATTHTVTVAASDGDGPAGDAVSAGWDYDGLEGGRRTAWLESSELVLPVSVSPAAKAPFRVAATLEPEAPSSLWAPTVGPDGDIYEARHTAVVRVGQTSARFFVPMIDDNIVEDDWTWVAALEVSGAALGAEAASARRELEVVVRDDDQAEVLFARRGDPDGNIWVVLSRPVRFDLNLRVLTRDGSASPDVDFGAHRTETGELLTAVDTGVTRLADIRFVHVGVASSDRPAWLFSGHPCIVGTSLSGPPPPDPPACGDYRLHEHHRVDISRPRSAVPTVRLAPAPTPVPADWALAPSGLSAGDRFRLLFLTSSKHPASSSDIDTYNASVQARAAAGHQAIRGYSGGFRVVGSTAAVDARDNAMLGGPGAPIYWLGGAKAADGNADFCDRSWGSYSARDESGAAVALVDDETLIGNGVWTGSDHDCTGRAGHELGTNRPQLASVEAPSGSAHGPLRIAHPNAVNQPNTHSRYLYAVSETFVAEDVPPVRGKEGAPLVWELTADPKPSVPLVATVWATQDGDWVSPGWLGWRHVVIGPSGTATYTVPTVDDRTDEPDGTVTLHLASQSAWPGGFHLGTPSAAAQPVADDDAAGSGGQDAVAAVPEVSVVASAGGTEGADVQFMVAAGPAPAAPLAVTVAVSQDGDWLAQGEAGTRTVAIPTTGTVTVRLGTVDDGADEPNGSVTLTIRAGSGYTLGAPASEKAPVHDDDDPLPAQQQQAPAVDTSEAETLIASMIARHRDVTGNAGALANWQKALKTIRGEPGGFTVAELEAHVEAVEPGVPRRRWDKILTVVEQLAAAAQQQQQGASSDDATLPELRIGASGSPVTEGGDAGFVVAAVPAPAEPLAVTVTVAGGRAASGHTGPRTVTIPTTGVAAVAVATADDDARTPPGDITATVGAGDGWTVSAARATAAVTVEDDDPAPAPAAPAAPEITVAAGPAITEGAAASFTVTADPAPAAPLTVAVTVIESGDFGAAAGPATVTIPAGGSAAHAVATAGDSTDEPDGSLTLTVNPGRGYAVSPGRPAATVAVSDDDDPPSPPSCRTADTALLAEVEAKTQDPWNGSRPDLVDTFGRARDTMLGEDDYTVADLKARPDRQTPNWQGAGPNALWQKIYTELDSLEACREKAPTPPTPTPAPQVAVTAGAGVTEGGAAGFTISVSPAPSSPLSVVVTVTQTGDYGAAVGAQTVAIPTSGTKAFSVATAGDGADEADGSVTLTVNAGSGYTVSTPQGAATVAVADDDPPQDHDPREPDPQDPDTPDTDPPDDPDPQDDPPPPPPDPDLEVSVTAGSGITEGQSATFTVSASPAPKTPLTVTVTVTAAGDHGATTGTRTVVVGTGGAANLAVATVGDSTDEPDGSVTLTVDAGSGYTVSSSQGAATVAVKDDDDPPPPPVPAGPALSVRDVEISENGRYLRFMVYLSETPDRTVSVRLSTRDGTARDGADYRGYAAGAGRLMTFTAGTRLLYRYVYIAILNDGGAEGDETFQAVLTDPQGAAVAQGTATVTIKDDD